MLASHGAFPDRSQAAMAAHKTVAQPQKLIEHSNYKSVKIVRQMERIR